VACAFPTGAPLMVELISEEKRNDVERLAAAVDAI
jgi:hypothetical protein